jgi:hypothetical protein
MRSEALTSSPKPAIGAVGAGVEVAPVAVVVIEDVLTGLVAVVLVVDGTGLVLIDAVVVTAVVDGGTVAVVAVVGGESANAVATPTANSSTATTPAIPRPRGIHDQLCDLKNHSAQRRIPRAHLARTARTPPEQTEGASESREGYAQTAASVVSYRRRRRRHNTGAAFADGRR